MLSLRNTYQFTKLVLAAAMLVLPASVAGDDATAFLPAANTDAPKAVRPLSETAGGLIQNSFSQVLNSEAGLAAFQTYLHNKATGNAGETLADSTHTLSQQWADGFAASLLTAGEAQLQRLAAVRQVDLTYQTNLGGRKWHAGVAALGALHQRNNRLFGYQLQAFRADDATLGAGLGALYRWTTPTALLGGNVFLDYENGDYGNHWRWSLGGEARNQHGRAHANYYVPFSDDRALRDEDAGLTAYSKRGWDLGVTFDNFKNRQLSGGLAYYHFAGKYGDADDSGLRYHLAFAPHPQLNLQLEYDEGDASVGGGVVWHYRPGSPNAAASGGAASADATFSSEDYLYAPVSREWTQRIGVADTTERVTAGDISGEVTINGTTVTTTTRYSGRAQLNIATAANSGLVLARTWRVTIGSEADVVYARSALAVNAGAVGYASGSTDGGEPLTAIVANLAPPLTIGLRGTAVSVVITNGDLDIYAVEGTIIVYHTAPGNYVEEIRAEATMYYVDASGNLLLYTPVALPAPAAAFQLANNWTGVLTTLEAGGGSDSGISYTADHADIRIDASGEVELTAPLPASAEVQIIAADASNGSSATITLTLSITDAVALANTPANINLRIPDSTAGAVIHDVEPSAGSGNYTFTMDNTAYPNASIDADSGVITFISAETNETTFALTVTVTDTTNGSTATAVINIGATDAVALANTPSNINIAVPDNSTAGAVIHDVEPSAGSGNYTFTMDNTAYPNAGIDTNTGVITFTAAETNEISFELTITVTDTTNGSTATATITVAVQEFVLPHASINIAAAPGVFYTATATGGSGNTTYAANVVSGNASGISIDTNTGALRFATDYYIIGSDDIRIQIIATDTDTATTSTATLTVAVTNRIGITGGGGAFSVFTGSNTYAFATVPYDVGGAAVTNLSSRDANITPPCPDTSVPCVDITQTLTGSSGAFTIGSRGTGDFDRQENNTYLIAYTLTGSNAAPTRLTLTVNVIAPTALVLGDETVDNLTIADNAQIFDLDATGGTGNYTYSINNISGVSGADAGSDGVEVNPTSGVLTFTDDYYLHGSDAIEIEVAVSDSHNDVADETAVITITPTNRLAGIARFTDGDNNTLPDDDGYAIAAGNYALTLNFILDSTFANGVQASGSVVSADGIGNSAASVVTGSDFYAIKLEDTERQRTEGNGYTLVVDVAANSARERLTIEVDVVPLVVDDTIENVTAPVGGGVIITITPPHGGSYTYAATSDNVGVVGDDSANAIVINNATGELSFVSNYYLQGLGDVTVTVTITDTATNLSATATILIDIANRTRIASGIVYDSNGELHHSISLTGSDYRNTIVVVTYEGSDTNSYTSIPNAVYLNDFIYIREGEDTTQFDYDITRDGISAPATGEYAVQWDVTSGNDVNPVVAPDTPRERFQITFTITP